MTIPYLLRLFCLCLAAFFLVHLAAGFAVVRLTSTAIRLAERMPASRASGFLLALRLMPPVVALIAVAGFCAPSYLWLEPRATAEEVGWGLVAAAVLGAAIWVAALIRTSRALWHLPRWERGACELRIAGAFELVTMVEGPAPMVALVGVCRPRLVMTRGVMEALASEELLAALSHERAHRRSCDNFKRLLLLLTPGLLPAWPGLVGVERGWARFAEWAADDCAAAGDPHRAVSLAAALVRVARLGTATVTSPLVTSLLPDSGDLSTRVDRLLDSARTTDSGKWLDISISLLAALAATGLAILIRQPGTLYWVHETLERLVH